MTEDLAYGIRHVLMERYHWTWGQVAAIPDRLLRAVLDA